MKKILISVIGSFIYLSSFGQVDNDQTGAWYMYFYNKQFKNSQWGFQGDFQYRHWDLLGDLEQLLLRSGVTYTPAGSGITFTLGYANITTGEFGESDDTFNENRIYQEALIPQKLWGRMYLVHRFRYEQRWVAGQDFRTRYRYNIFINIPLTHTEIVRNAVYLAFYNEIFINGQTGIGDGRTVSNFDRNRTYWGLGYSLTDHLRVQIGWMRQTTANWQKGQLQMGLHHNF